MYFTVCYIDLQLFSV